MTREFPFKLGCATESPVSEERRGQERLESGDPRGLVVKGV